VGHIDEGDAGTALQLLQLAAHAFAQLGVEIAERLVEQQDFRLDNEAARQRDPLLLPTAELVGHAIFETRQVDMGERLVDQFAGFRVRTLRTRNPKTTFSNTVLCGQTA